MNISVTNQAMVFLISILGGAVTGVIFDFFRAFRKRVKSGNTSVAVQDILFWLISAGVVFYFMYRYNNGEPRWYIFGGIVLGAIIYQNTISVLVVELTVRIYSILIKTLVIIVKIITFPVVLLAKILKTPFFLVMMPVKTVARFFRKRARNFRADGTKSLKRIKKRLKMY